MPLNVSFFIGFLRDFRLVQQTLTPRIRNLSVWDFHLPYGLDDMTQYALPEHSLYLKVPP